ncbi:MFS transporter [Camelliibacillus cellulosilyticus]|uniref:MFS transporter n=1 Tax=Camelliibacillus cellulosilyticus TaxID=2174486 RepID=A0ABV9GN43_9BACL
MKNAFSVFKKMDYTRMFFAAFTSRMGSVIGMTAFAFYLLHRFSEQPFYVSLTEMMYSLPTLAVFFIVGVLADRMDRQKIAANSEWISAVLSLILIGAIAIGWMPLIFTILFIRSAIGNFFSPAEQALVQGVLTDKEYTSAAGLNQMTASIFMLFGNGIGIAFYWLVGVQGAVLADAISFIISGILIRTCRLDEGIRLPNGKHRFRDLKPHMMFNDFKLGLIYTLKHKLLLALIAGFFVFGAVNGAFSVIPLFILKYKLVPTSYETWAIWEGIALGAGILVGSVIASSIAGKFKLYQLIYSGLLPTGLLAIACAFVQNVYLYLGLVFVIALLLPFANVAIGGWLPKIVDPKMMGRVEGLINPLMMVSQTLALAAISALFPAFLTVGGLFVAVGLLVTVVAVFYFFVLPRLARNFEMENEIAEEPSKALV